MVERVEGERGATLSDGLGPAAEAAEDEGAQIAGAEIVGVNAEGAVEVVEGARPVVARAIEFGEGVKASGLPRVVPRGFVDGSVGLGEL